MSVTVIEDKIAFQLISDVSQKLFTYFHYLFTCYHYLLFAALTIEGYCNVIPSVQFYVSHRFTSNEGTCRASDYKGK